MTVALNKFIGIGRLTRDPEAVSLSNGDRLAKFGIAINERKKNRQTGEWEDDPVFIDCQAWAKTAEFVLEHCKKGSLVVVEDSRLKMETWEDKNGGGRRSKLLLNIQGISFVPGQARKEEDGGDGDAPPARQARPVRQAPPKTDNGFDAGEGEDDIPF